MTSLPTLYKRTSTGALQEWTVYYGATGYWVRFGQTGGAIQQSEQTVCYGKNSGRSNATTQAQQAEIEARALHTKKLTRGGYVDSPEKAMAGEISELIRGGEWPMLAQHYKDNVGGVVWPCYSQIKYNGHRCIAVIDENGMATLWSRKRNPILSVPHIVEALNRLGRKNVKFDGELFDFDYVREHGLEGFNHLVRRDSPIPGHEVAKYHIYDAPVPDLTQTQRFEYLDEHLGANPEPPLMRAETRLLLNIGQAMAFLGEAIDAGQEGIMLRMAAGLYRGHPTTHVKDLLKLKGRDGECDDAEFKVVGVKAGKKGKMQDKAMLVCVTDAGEVFDVKMKGPMDALRKYLVNPDMIVGKMITVEFNGWTEKNIPWFPRALQPREDL